MKAIDLFAGAGGLSLGLQMAGIDVVAAIDHDHDACETYRANIADHIIEADIHDIDPATLPDCDLIAGGPPCQGFSFAGKRNKDDPRNQLWKEYFRIVEAKQPAFILIENVRGMLAMGEDKALILAFRRIGYRVTPYLCNAADYGVPQIRYRVFFIGNRIGIDNTAPTQTHAEPNGTSMMFSMLPHVTVGQALGVYDSPRNTSKHVVTLRTDHGVLDLDRPSCVIKAGGGIDASGHEGGATPPSISISPTMLRRLTPRECATLQDFPPNFEFHGTKTSQHRQIGNAVPPGMARAIGLAILAVFSEAIRRAA